MIDSDGVVVGYEDFENPENVMIFGKESRSDEQEMKELKETVRFSAIGSRFVFVVDKNEKPEKLEKPALDVIHLDRRLRRRR